MRCTIVYPKGEVTFATRTRMGTPPRKLIELRCVWPHRTALTQPDEEITVSKSAAFTQLAGGTCVQITTFSPRPKASFRLSLSHLSCAGSSPINVARTVGRLDWAEGS